MRLAGDAMDEVDDLGQPIIDDTFLLLLNGWQESVPFRLPAADRDWERVFDTADGGLAAGAAEAMGAVAAFGPVAALGPEAGRQAQKVTAGGGKSGMPAPLTAATGLVAPETEYELRGRSCTLFMVKRPAPEGP